jgi:hypothetical protein
LTYIIIEKPNTLKYIDFIKTIIMEKCIVKWEDSELVEKFIFHCTFEVALSFLKAFIIHSVFFSKYPIVFQK